MLPRLLLQSSYCTQLLNLFVTNDFSSIYHTQNVSSTAKCSKQLDKVSEWVGIWFSFAPFDYILLVLRCSSDDDSRSLVQSLFHSLLLGNFMWHIRLKSLFILQLTMEVVMSYVMTHSVRTYDKQLQTIASVCTMQIFGWFLSDM